MDIFQPDIFGGESEIDFSDKRLSPYQRIKLNNGYRVAGDKSHSCRTCRHACAKKSGARAYYKCR